MNKVLAGYIEWPARLKAVVLLNLEMDVELLNVERTANFITYCMEYDLQVKVNRTTAASLFGHTIARPGEADVIRYSAEKFDKIQTFLASNDQQVHYASAERSVGVYAITRLLGELRRTVRDHSATQYLNMLSPRNPIPSAGRGGGLALGSGFGLISARELAHRATRPPASRELPHQRARQESSEVEVPFGSVSERESEHGEGRFPPESKEPVS